MAGPGRLILSTGFAALFRSNRPDRFAFILAAVFAADGAMWFAGRSRRFFFAFFPAALLPLILGLGGTAMRWYANERILSLTEIDPSSEAAAEIRQNMLPESAITLLIGVGSASLPLLIGIAGILLKNKN